MFWVSQNWTAQEALNTVLDSNYYGSQLFGIRAAAKAYFKKNA
jgi:membrane peptidoglycan carboxypeptidase